MKTKYWIILLGILFGLSLVLSLAFFLPGDANTAEIWSDGKLLYKLRLTEDQVLTVPSSHGTNIIRVQDGAVAVTEADCPDGWCVKMGYRSGGAQIVCLPNKLVIRFTNAPGPDGISG